VPPGIADAVVPNPVFSLTPAATVDEGNNWINISWGPLSMVSPATSLTLGNYSLPSSSPDVDHITLPETFAGAGQNGVTTVTPPATDFFGNPRPDAAGKVDIGAVEFQGAATAPGAPTVIAISPSTGGQGETVVVTLTGTNLGTTTQVNLTPSAGINVTNVTPLSSTQVQATFIIAGNANTTARSVTVLANGASVCSGSPACTFNVTILPKPTLASISPASGEQGTTVQVTLTGKDFTPGSTVAPPTGSGVTVSNVTVVSSTQINATFTIATNASPNHNVTVTNAAGSSGSVTFTVGPLTAPVLSGIAPSQANASTTSTAVAVKVTLTGANFATGTGTAVTVTPTSGTSVITVSNLTVVDSSTITATFNIGATTLTQPYNVTVTTLAGSSVPVTFTVN
jgi:hypothetical protein